MLQATSPPTSGRPRGPRSTTSIAAVVALCALAACGSSDSASDTTIATTIATTSAATAPPSVTDVSTIATTLVPSTLPTTSAPASTPPTVATSVADTTPAASAPPTTVADTRPVDVTAQTVAVAGTLAAADFPDPWTQYSPGGELAIDPTGCSYRPDGPTTKIPRSGGQNGPTMQFGDTGAFVSSSAFAFPDEATASEYIAVVNTDEWGTCRAAQLQQYQRDNGGEDITVNVTSRTTDTLGQSGFEAYGEFSFTDAAGDLTRVVLISFYRLGPTVIIENEEYGALDESQNTAFFDDAYNALDAAYKRVNALQ